jgi:hypothetical protein
MSDPLYLIVEDRQEEVIARRLDFERKYELRRLKGQYNKIYGKVKKELCEDMPVGDMGLSLRDGELRRKFLERIDELVPGLRDNIENLEKEREEVFLRKGFPRLKRNDVLPLSKILELQYETKG